MGALPTVVILVDGERRRINASDYDQKIHTLAAESSGSVESAGAGVGSPPSAPVPAPPAPKKRGQRRKE